MFISGAPENSLTVQVNIALHATRKFKLASRTQHKDAQSQNAKLSLT